MYFYKYSSVNPLSLMMLKRGEIYFASPTELNDRQECRSEYVFHGPKEIWLRFIDYILISFFIEYKLLDDIKDEDGIDKTTNLVHENFIKNNKKKYYSTLILSKAMTRSIIEVLDRKLSLELKRKAINFISKLIFSIQKNDIHQKKYIASFSRTAVNPTMWGHYANAERGFVVIYRTNNDCVNVESSLKNLYGTRNKVGYTEIGYYDNGALKLNTVKYSGKICKINGFRSIVSKLRFSEEEDRLSFPESLFGKLNYMQEENIGLVKYTDWKYEKEVRLLFPTFESTPSELRCLQVKFEHIKGVIFGVNTSNSDKEKIIMACYHYHKSNQLDADFSFFQAHDNPKNYQLDLKPIGILTDSYYDDELPIKRFHDLEYCQQNLLKEMCKSHQ